MGELALNIPLDPPSKGELGSDVPAYLRPSGDFGRVYGHVEFDAETNEYVISAESMVMVFAKRLFPGAPGRRRQGTVGLPATYRGAGDLAWLMQRYPLEVRCEERFASDLEKAAAHHARRVANASLTPSPLPGGEGYSEGAVWWFGPTLFEYQREAVPWLIANERCLLGDDMGLGKTITALAALGRTGAYPVLVVCPPNVQSQWMKHAETCLGLSALEIHQVQGRKPYALPAAKVYVTHYLLLEHWRRELSAAGIETVIFDEVQELRRTESLKYSAAIAQACEARYVWGLSGTPIYNRGTEVWAILHAIENYCLGGRDSFTMEWGGYPGAKDILKPDVLGAYLRQEGLLLRRRKADVARELPPKRRIVFDVAHDQNAYRKAIADVVELARSLDRITDRHERWKRMGEIDRRSRQATGIAKAPYVADFVETLVESGERPLVFAYHHAVYDAIEERFARRGHAEIARITGRQDQKAKEWSKARFINGVSPLLLLSLRTSAGLDGLQETGTCVVFAELDWSPAILSQCEDRLHRYGVQVEESVLCYYCVSGTSHDEIMMTVLGLKRAQFSGIFNEGQEEVQDEDTALRAAEKHLGDVIERLKRGVDG